MTNFACGNRGVAISSSTYPASVTVTETLSRDPALLPGPAASENIGATVPRLASPAEAGQAAPDPQGVAQSDSHDCIALRIFLNSKKDVKFEEFTFSDLATVIDDAKWCIKDPQTSPAFRVKAVDLALASVARMGLGEMADKESCQRQLDNALAGWQRTLDAWKASQGTAPVYLYVPPPRREVTQPSVLRQPIHCTSNTIGDFTYTNCY